jgi:hypothetical protein
VKDKYESNNRWTCVLDYKKIYKDFIQNRMSNPPADDEYCEIHHILPKCMGGSNAKSNLIRLRADDHFFAHLILAKSMKGDPIRGKLWVTVRFMAEIAYGKMNRKSHGDRIYIPRTHRLYALVRATAARENSGLNNPNTNKTIYDFVRKDGLQRTYTMNELCREFSLEIRLVYKVCVEKSRKTHKEWALQETALLPTFHWQRGNGHNLKRTDQTVHHWTHKDGRTLTGRCYDLSALSENYATSRFQNVVKRIINQAYGWYLTKDHEVAPTITSIIREKRRLAGDVITLKHVDGSVITGVRSEIGEKINGSASMMCMLMSGTVLNVRGWMLPETDPSTINLEASRLSKFQRYLVQSHTQSTERSPETLQNLPINIVMPSSVIPMSELFPH